MSLRALKALKFTPLCSPGMLERIPMAKASLDQLLAMGKELRDLIHELLEGDTVLIYPSHPMTAPRLVLIYTPHITI